MVAQLSGSISIAIRQKGMPKPKNCEALRPKVSEEAAEEAADLKVSRLVNRFEGLLDRGTCRSFSAVKAVSIRRWTNRRTVSYAT